MSKNDPKITKLDKYDVEANIEEVANSENQSLFKYGFTALSNPKNVRLAIEGIARIQGDADERNAILDKDENDIPKILTMIYQELFPTFFLLSKSLNVSCPPHTISGVALSEETQTDELSEDSELSNDLLESQPEPAATPPQPEPAATPPQPEPAATPPQAESVPETKEASDVVQPTV